MHTLRLLWTGAWSFKAQVLQNTFRGIPLCIAGRLCNSSRLYIIPLKYHVQFVLGTNYYLLQHCQVLLVEIVLINDRLATIVTKLHWSQSILWHILKCYSQIILCGVLLKFLDFGYFVLIWWQSDK